MISHRLGDFERDQADSYLHPRIYTDVEQKVSEVLMRLTLYAAVITYNRVGWVLSAPVVKRLQEKNLRG